MPSKQKTQKVDRSSFINYLKKALECRRAMTRSLASGDWNAAAICAVHSSISACDALCVFSLGLRYSGSHHPDASVILLSISPNDDRFKTNAARLRRIVDIKNMAEYEVRLVYRKESERAVADCERFIEFILSQLPAGEAE